MMNGNAFNFDDFISNPITARRQIDEYARTNLQGITNPESHVQEMLNNGEMTQSQYNTVYNLTRMAMKVLPH